MAVFKYKDSEGNIKSLINMIGPQGPEGPANNLTIGEVTKGIEAEATITGETPNQVLNLVLPQGDTGVYVGTEEPTDDNVNVWINPEGAETTEIARKDYVDEAIEEIEKSIDAVNSALNGVVLYENESGSKTPTLSNSTSDYSRIDIELYDTNTLKYNTITIYSPNGKNYLYSRCETGTASWYLYQIIFTISDTSIIYADSYTYAGHKSEYRDYTTWVITKVIGYK